MEQGSMGMSTQKKANYRIYDRTGGGATNDIYADTLEEAVESGRAWIEDGDWASEDGVIRKGVTLDACVREIVTRPEDPVDSVYSLSWDLWSPEWDEASSRWVIDVSDIHDAEDGRTDNDERTKVAEALSKATGGAWTYEHDGERCVWVQVPANWPIEDITDEQQENDCSGSHSDEEPKCAIGGGTDDDTGHEWRSPFSLLGGLKENPGVWSRGGTVIETKCVCARCGKYRTETDAGSQRNPEQPESIVEYESANEDSEAWLLRIHQEDGWIPSWLAEQLDRPPTTRYTEDQAKKYVAEHTDDDDLDADDLEHVFAALFGRRAKEKDRAEGLWSHCCAAA